MSRKVGDNVKNKLWASVQDQASGFASFIPALKANRKQGKSKDQVIHECVLELCRTMYEAGLERGYDMGYEVAGGNIDTANPSNKEG